MADDRRLVWDLPLRLFHWLFATCIAASYVTAKLGFDWMQWHFNPGTAPSVGHNPVGGLMVLLMLLLVAIQAGTGLFTTDAVVWAGPYNPSVSESKIGRA